MLKFSIESPSSSTYLANRAVQTTTDIFDQLPVAQLTSLQMPRSICVASVINNFFFELSKQ